MLAMELKEETMDQKEILPDLLSNNLWVVFCGTAIGKISAQKGSYYADPGNKFWHVLYKVGLTPIELKSGNYKDLLKYGIGLTDLCKDKVIADKKIRREDCDIEGFERKILYYQPKIVCFNGKKAAKIYLNKKDVDYSFQKEKIGETFLFVTPSTSGAAARWWCENLWQALSDFVKK